MIVTAKYVELSDKAVFMLSGDDCISFLEGLITNEAALLLTQPAIYAGLLTPQGKYLYDMIIIASGNQFYVVCEAESLPHLIKRLKLYKLRADVTITDISHSHKVFAILGDSAGKIENADSNSVIVADPRHNQMGYIAISEHAPDLETIDSTDYNALRIKLTIPNSSQDIAREKYFWLETNAEALNGVSFTKGCYVGQELTARMKHRTSIKKSLVSFTYEGSTAPTARADIITSEGKKIGTIHSSAGGYSLGYIKLDSLNNDLSCDGINLSKVD